MVSVASRIGGIVSPLVLLLVSSNGQNVLACIR